MFTSVPSAKWLLSSPCLMGTPTTPRLTLPGTSGFSSVHCSLPLA